MPIFDITSGIVYDSEGNPMLKIKNDGSIKLGENKSRRWTKDGILTVDGKEILKIEPNDSQLYPSASLVF